MSGSDVHVTAVAPARGLGRVLSVARMLCSVLVIAVPVSMLLVHELWIKVVLLAVFGASVGFWRSVQFVAHRRRLIPGNDRGGGNPARTDRRLSSNH